MYDCCDVLFSLTAHNVIYCCMQEQGRLASGSGCSVKLGREIVKTSIYPQKQVQWHGLILWQDMIQLQWVVVVAVDVIVVESSPRLVPLPSSRQRLSSDDCLEDRREDCQNCSVLYCV